MGVFLSVAVVLYLCEFLLMLGSVQDAQDIDEHYESRNE